MYTLSILSKQEVITAESFSSISYAAGIISHGQKLRCDEASTGNLPQLATQMSTPTQEGP